MWRSELDLVSPTKGTLGETVLLSGADYSLFFGTSLTKVCYTDNIEGFCVQASVDV